MFNDLAAIIFAGLLLLLLVAAIAIAAGIETRARREYERASERIDAVKNSTLANNRKGTR
jgi:hypothetical protein